MYETQNRNAVARLSRKSFRANKTRNLIAVIAIALTTVLFTALFTLGIGMMESFQNQTLRQAGGDGHAALKYITQQQYEDIKDDPLIKDISFNQIISTSVDNEQLLRRRAEMYYMDDTALRLGFCEPTVGTRPVKENEIITDTKTLDRLGLPHEVGVTVPLSYTMHGKQYQTDFILSGYWESDPVFNVGFVIVSKAFTEAHQEQLAYTFDQDYDMTGVINCYVMFKNGFELESKLEKIITNNGYTMPQDGVEREPLPTDIRCNVNWAYLSSNFSVSDPTTLAGGISGGLLIILTGYLIIYNIFQISVIRDIKFYGLLKTIGTTSRQIKRIITRQALMLSLIGIPIGLILGYLIGKLLLPLTATAMELDRSQVSLNPVIFIGSAIFALITVFISTRKPGRIAAKVSPVEAVRYSGVEKGLRKKDKKTTDGGKLHWMALSNLGRNKKRTITVILSMSLSLVLLNSIFTLTTSFDMDKFLSTFVDTDYLIAHAEYFNYNYNGTETTAVTESFIENVKAQEGFEEGGRIYMNSIMETSVDDEKSNGISKYGYELTKAADGRYSADIYGAEQLPLSRLDMRDGELDLEKLATGKYIIEGINTNDHGVADWNSIHFQVGEKVTVYVNGEPHEYEVIGHVAYKYYINTSRRNGDYCFYLPSEEYLRIVDNPAVMSFSFNVSQDQEKAMNSFLEKYVENVEPVMNYSSKDTYLEQFSSLQSALVIVGGALTAIIGLIGVLNFINSILTSIIARRREFAMLQSIGMTRGQLIKMLCFEGVYYAIFTILGSAVLGVLTSVFLIGGITKMMWFLSYHFVIVPILITYPFLLIFSVLAPYVAYRSTSRQSIVERLRDSE